MASDNFRIEIKLASTLKAIKRQANRAKRLRTPLRRAGLWMERSTKLNFVKESDPDGKPWAPLKPSTLRSKKTNAKLRETGALIASIAMQGPSGNQVRVVAGQEYGIWHQTGTSRMVARPFMGFSEEKDIPKITKIFEDYFES